MIDSDMFSLMGMLSLIGPRLLLFGAISIAVSFVGMVVMRKLLGVSPDIETLRDGIPAEASILKVWDTGLVVNNNPQVGMDLEVRPPSGSHYQAQTKKVLSMSAIPQYQPGAVVSVKISKKDPNKVVIDIKR